MGNMGEVTPGTQLAKIRGFENGFFATHLINIGAEVGLFEALHEAEGGMTVEELASRLRLQEPPLRIWCQTAYRYEILDCDEEGRFHLEPFLDEILGDRNSVRNYLANIKLTVEVAGKALEGYPALLKTGEVIENPYIPEFTQLVEELTRNIFMAFLYRIIPGSERLKRLFDRGIRLLDIGCGSGNLIIGLARAFPNCTFVGLDADINGIESARKKISRMDLGDRVSVENRRGESLSCDEEFDVATMVVTLHEVDPAVREKLVQGVYRALRPGGVLVVLDFPYPGRIEDFRDPLYDFAVTDQFFEVYAGIFHITTEERDDMLLRAGFEDIQVSTIGKGLFQCVTATKRP